MGKKQHYMTYEERIALEALRKAKIPVSEIAKQLGFCRATIYNELKRGNYWHQKNYSEEKRYSAARGQDETKKQQKKKGRRSIIEKNPDYKKYLEQKIKKDRYSPYAAIQEAIKEGYPKISVNSIYNWIDQGKIKVKSIDLWERVRRKRQRKTNIGRIAHKKLPSIEKRPDQINNRSEYGHWEMDLIVSGKGSKAALLTLTERKTREEIIRKVKDKKAETIRKEIDKLEKTTPDFKKKFKTITTDNGTEFLKYEELKKSRKGKEDRFKIYYCHSYAAWEKGSNENANKMIRRFFPKGTDFKKIDNKKIKEVENWINSYPRAIHQGRSAMDEMATITIFSKVDSIF